MELESALEHWKHRAEMAEKARDLLLQVLSPTDDMLKSCGIPTDTDFRQNLG